METERKSFTGQIKQGDEPGSFEAVIATLGVVDSDGDIIEPGAFGGATTSVIPAHDHRSVPLGKATMEDRGNQAVAVGMFNLDVAAAKDWHSALKFDLENGETVQEWSFAYGVIDSEMETRDGEQVRILKKLDVIEVSPVLRGAGVNTGTLAAKRRFADQLDETLKSLDDTLDRAKSVTELRQGKTPPKNLSEAHQATISALQAKFEELVTLLKSGDDDSDYGTEIDALANSLAADAARLGVDIAD